MADLLSGLGLLEKFSLIFPFLLILVLVYALLSVTKVLGDNKGVHALIALALAVITLFSVTARSIINIMAPWFVILFIFIIFMLMAFRTFGEVNFMSFLGTDSGRTVAMWVVAIGVIIFLGSISAVVFGQGGSSSSATTTTVEGQQQVDANGNPVELGQTGTVAATGAGAFWSTLVHPNVLGLALLLLVAMFTIQRLAGFGT